MTKLKTFLYEYLYVIMLILLILLLVILPSKSISSFYEGLIIWATKVLPALLPFFILTKLLSYTRFISKFGNFISPVTRKLYGVGGVSGYIYLISIISGYPIGAKLTSDAYNNKIIDKKQAYTITSFTSTSGPLFILGTTGIGLFGSAKLGYLIMICHYLGALLNGLLYRNKQSESTKILNTTIPDNPLSESMTNSIISIMTVGGFIALFYMILDLMLTLNIFSPLTNLLSSIGIDTSISTGVISGIIEVTTGAIMLSKLSLSFELSLIILTFLISFGGISIHMQAYCFLKNFDMPYHKFLFQKFTHAIFSTFFAILIVFII